MVLTGIDVKLPTLLKTLESKSTREEEKAEAYRLFSDQLHQDELSFFDLDISAYIDPIVSVLQHDILDSCEAVRQGALQVLGFCLHDLELARLIPIEKQSILITNLCKCLETCEDKCTSTRALWVLSKQNIQPDLIAKQLDSIMVSVEHCLTKWKTQAQTVEFEALNAIARLNVQVAKEMKEKTSWEKLCLKFLTHPAMKVREKALVTLEKGSEVVTPGNRDVVKAIVPEFKSKTAAELKRLFPGNEIYILRCWSFLVKYFGEELHHGGFINILLPIVEMGFKHLEPEVKVAAFKAWKSLIDNFATNPSIVCDPKRIKLIMQVFKANNAKIESVAMEKFHVWLHFLRCLGTKISVNFDQVVVPLLQFCTGGNKLNSASSTLPTTPRFGSKHQPTSPATPRLSLPSTPTSNLPSFPSLQLKGVEVLACILGQPLKSTDLPRYSSTTESFSVDVITSPMFFLKQSIVLVSCYKELVFSLATHLSEELLLYTWHALIGHVHVAVDMTPKTDHRDMFSYFLRQFQLISSLDISAHVLLKMVEPICEIPAKVLASNVYNVGGVGDGIMGTPALLLCEILLSPGFLKVAAETERFVTLYSKLVDYGMSNATGTLEFSRNVLEMLDGQVHCLGRGDLVWRFWSVVANRLLEHIITTSEVNQGDSLEYDFSCLYTALLLPVKHKVGCQVSQPVSRSLLKTWTDLYKAFSRHSALVTTAEDNVICEDFSAGIVHSFTQDDLKDPGLIDYLVPVLQVVVDCVNFSSLSAPSSFNLGPGFSPGKNWKKFKHKHLENLHSFVQLLTVLLDNSLDIAENTGFISGKKSTPSVTAAVNGLVDIVSTLVTHVSSSSIIANMFEKLADPLSKLYTYSSRKNGIKLYTGAFNQKLERLWLDISTCLQSRYNSIYDSDLLQQLSPLLIGTFTHPRRPIKNQTILLWNATFGRSSMLVYPEKLKNVLCQVKEKTPLSLPGWVTMDTTVIDDTPASQSQFSQLDVPEPFIPGLPSPHKVRGSFLSKAISPNIKKSPAKKIEHRSVGGVKKKLAIDGLTNEDYVVIQPPTKVTRILTDHQKESLKERKILPAMYTNLDQSQSLDISLLSQFNQDTQPETVVSIPSSEASEIIVIPSSQSESSQSNMQPKKPGKSIEDSGTSFKPPVRTRRRSVRFTSGEDDEDGDQVRNSKKTAPNSSDGDSVSSSTSSSLKQNVEGALGLGDQMFGSGKSSSSGSGSSNGKQDGIVSMETEENGDIVFVSQESKNNDPQTPESNSFSQGSQKSKFSDQGSQESRSSQDLSRVLDHSQDSEDPSQDLIKSSKNSSQDYANIKSTENPSQGSVNVKSPKNPAQDLVKSSKNSSQDSVKSSDNLSQDSPFAHIRSFSQSPIRSSRLKSPKRKSTSQESQRVSKSPNRKSPFTSGFSLDQWVVKSPVRGQSSGRSTGQGEGQSEVEVLVEDTQSPTRYKALSDPRGEKDATPARRRLEVAMETKVPESPENMVPESPENSQKGLPDAFVKIQKLSETEIQRYSQESCHDNSGFSENAVAEVPSSQGFETGTKTDSLQFFSNSGSLSGCLGNDGTQDSARGLSGILTAEQKEQLDKQYSQDSTVQTQSPELNESVKYDPTTTNTFNDPTSFTASSQSQPLSHMQSSESSQSQSTSLTQSGQSQPSSLTQSSGSSQSDKEYDPTKISTFDEDAMKKKRKQATPKKTSHVVPLRRTPRRLKKRRHSNCDCCSEKDTATLKSPLKVIEEGKDVDSQSSNLMTSIGEKNPESCDQSVLGDGNMLSGSHWKQETSNESQSKKLEDAKNSEGKTETEDIFSKAFTEDLISGSMEVTEDLMKGSMEVTDHLKAGSIEVKEDLMTGSIEVKEDLMTGSMEVTEDLLTGSTEVTEDLLTGSMEVTEQTPEGKKPRKEMRRKSTTKEKLAIARQRSAKISEETATRSRKQLDDSGLVEQSGGREMSRSSGNLQRSKNRQDSDPEMEMSGPSDKQPKAKRQCEPPACSESLQMSKNQLEHSGMSGNVLMPGTTNIMESNPDNDVRFPVGDDSRDTILGSKNKNPVTKNKDPVTKNKDPVTKNKDPVTKSTDPVTKNKDPVTKSKDSVTKNKNSVTKNTNTEVSWTDSCRDGETIKTTDPVSKGSKTGVPLSDSQSATEFTASPVDKNRTRPSPMATRSSVSKKRGKASHSPKTRKLRSSGLVVRTRTLRDGKKITLASPATPKASRRRGQKPQTLPQAEVETVEDISSQPVPDEVGGAGTRVRQMGTVEEREMGDSREKGIRGSWKGTVEEREMGDSQQKGIRDSWEKGSSQEKEIGDMGTQQEGMTDSLVSMETTGIAGRDVDSLVAVETTGTAGRGQQVFDCGAGSEGSKTSGNIVIQDDLLLSTGIIDHVSRDNDGLKTRNSVQDNGDDLENKNNVPQDDDSVHFENKNKVLQDVDRVDLGNENSVGDGNRADSQNQTNVSEDSDHWFDNSTQEVKKADCKEKLFDRDGEEKGSTSETSAEDNDLSGTNRNRITKQVSQEKFEFSNISRCESTQSSSDKSTEWLHDTSGKAQQNLVEKILHDGDAQKTFNDGDGNTQTSLSSEDKMGSEKPEGVNKTSRNMKEDLKKSVSDNNGDGNTQNPFCDEDRDKSSGEKNDEEARKNDRGDTGKTFGDWKTKKRFCDEDGDKTEEDNKTARNKEGMSAQSLPGTPDGTPEETPKKFKAARKRALVSSDSKVVGLKRLGLKPSMLVSARGLNIVRRSILQQRNTGDDQNKVASYRSGSPCKPVVSPSLSPSTGILKRRLSADQQSMSPSPPAKQRRVSFATPIVEGKSPVKYQEINTKPPSPLVTSAFTQLTTNGTKFLFGSPSHRKKTKVTSSFVDSVDSESQSSQSQTFKCSSDSEVGLDSPVFPDYVDCDIPVDKILAQLTSSLWSRGLTQLIRSSGKKIKTVGDLCRLSEYDINNLPIRHPKVATLKKALSMLDYSLPETASINREESARGKGDNYQRLATVKEDEERSELPSADEALERLGDLDSNIEDDNLKLSQSSDTDQPVRENAMETGINQLETESLLEKIKSIVESSDMEYLSDIRTGTLFRIHQQLTDLTNKVVAAIQSRCESRGNSQQD